jgi:hypothetical protein
MTGAFAFNFGIQDKEEDEKTPAFAKVGKMAKLTENIVI